MVFVCRQYLYYSTDRPTPDRPAPDFNCLTDIIELNNAFHLFQSQIIIIAISSISQKGL